ncbi:DUF6798 domain-containing protein [Schlesneria paludicola]|uniref:DUF6798 domain-containing protein n=1 Tax=Schlesneria paludicola TaxID=360056 RepID=UPI00029A5926|nr:DUF6798 domain-containing protein [Schlesneria paludicola]
MSGQRKHDPWLVPVLIWVTFFVYGAIAAPVPGVNEPHYLCKAKHFWHPQWCAGDFFLSSPNAHLVFYLTIGSLTTILPLETVAWIGRAAATGVLAIGWTRCFSRLFFMSWAPLWCAWVFLAFSACGNFSGEWLVGGVEGKVFAYGFLLLALGDVFRERNHWAAIWAGLAISFHPVVGIWGLMAYFLLRGMELARDVRRSSVGAPGQSLLASAGPAIFATFQELLLLTVVAIPGLVPVVQLLTESVSPETRFAGTYLQVYFRLAHHLDPMLFPLRSYLGYAALLLVWIASLSWGGRTNERRRFDVIVFGAVLFMVGGILVGYGPRPARLMPYFAERMNLLKFYPFRLGDLLLPVAVSVSLIGVLERTALFTSSESSRERRALLPQIMMLLVFVAALCRADSTGESNRYATIDRADWLDVCRWIDQNVSVDAVLQSPTNGWAFKWFARRAEYVAFKDCPQDAAGIVEWNRRLNFLQKWYEQNYADQLYSASELRGLREQTGMTHLLTDRLGPLEIEPIYRNGTFQVYDLTTLDQ